MLQADEQLAEVRQTHPDLRDPSLYINRELSWLSFNERVLAQARDSRHPLLDRLRFLAITETNLDEFFMIRISGLIRRAGSERPHLIPDGMTPEEQLLSIQRITSKFMAEQRRILSEELLPALSEQDIHLVSYKQLSGSEKAELRRTFKSQILPILTPLAIDPAHPFPHISSLSLNFLVVLKGSEGEVMARVKVPTTLTRFMPLKTPDEPPLPGQHHPVRLVRLEEVITANLNFLFAGKQIADCYVFQVTRDADLVIQEDEASDLLQAIEDELDRRWFGQSVRLVVTDNMPTELQQWLAHHVEVSEAAIYPVSELIGLADLEEFARLDRPDLLYPPPTPHIPQSLRGASSIFSAISQGDLLLYHPYDSFAPVVEFVQAAALDPDVLAIKQTLYRVGSNQPMVAALLEARDEHTQVAVVVELKARFDEEPNIGWARQLEAQGVHVAYGLVGLKTHAKICLIVRREGGELVRYLHLGTGNYNPTTARIYTDFSFFTNDPDLGEDGSDLFNYLTGFSEQTNYKKLLVAPVTLRTRLKELIDEQTERALNGQETRIVFKSNSITDPEIIEALYRASGSGVQIDLIIRGICCLRPGIAGVSDNIRVYSLVGRFLEHARIYCFGPRGEEQFYLGSADVMQRNLDRRIETLFPLRSTAHKEKVGHILELQLNDTVNSWELLPDGSYTRRRPADNEEPQDSQALLLAAGSL